ncbi:hypothetical protein [Plantactinospora sp. GCM10030261]|uniref:hypothetical protein n=1 Tax=Plantactinospora sp. GCM10030261 TaxID=3273420 RepID=UPI003615463B
MGKSLTVAEMTVRQLVRRRGVLLLLLLLPLGFYVMRRDDSIGQSVRSLLLGIGWAVSVAALFATTSAREMETRLRLGGYRTHHLYGGRMLGIWLLGLPLAVPFLILLAVDMPTLRLGATALALLTCVLVAAPLGMLIGALLSREMEGTLLLLTIVGVQMTMDPADSAARIAPFWASREITTYAVDHTDTGYLTRGLLHGALFTVALVLLVALISGIRLRTRRHVRFG